MSSDQRQVGLCRSRGAKWQPDLFRGPKRNVKRMKRVPQTLSEANVRVMTGAVSAKVIDLLSFLGNESQLGWQPLIS